MSYLNVESPPDAYKCVTKVNNKLKNSQCGPTYSLQHMLSNLLEFDIEYIYEKSIPKWNADLIAKVNISKYPMLVLLQISYN